MVEIAVLITCHNRKAKTLACLAHLFVAARQSDAIVSVVLVDDGSTDGTSEAVVGEYPGVHIIRGSGHLYWNRGMRTAFGHALGKHYPFYLWLNDDTYLYPGAIQTMLQTASEVGGKAIIVGSIQERHGSRVNHGGILKWTRLNSRLVDPGSEPIECATMLGNCVLIPAAVAETVGNLDNRFSHAIGDVDYGLRAKRMGIRIFVMPGFAGVCSLNSVEGTYLDPAVPFGVRLKKVLSPKGLPPGEFFTFLWRHFKLVGVAYWGWTYVKVALVSFKFKLSERSE